MKHEHGIKTAVLYRKEIGKMPKHEQTLNLAGPQNQQPAPATIAWKPIEINKLADAYIIDFLNKETR